MKAVVYHGPHDMRVENVADPGLQEPTDALLRIERTAICGSDLHLWHSEAFAEAVEPGFVVGHEFLGTVLEVGSAVRRVRPGDRVLVACTTGCGECASCRAGLASGCPVTTAGFTRQNVFGFSHELWGGRAGVARLPFAAATGFAVPPDLDDEQVLFLTDILPTGELGAELARVGVGETVVVFGCGPVGTFAQRCAAVRGAAQVIAVDLDRDRLARAERSGAVALHPGDGDLLERVLELTDGLGAHCAIEAVGSSELVHQAAAVVRPGGRIAAIGVILEPWQIEWPLFFAKNLTLASGLVSPQASIHRLLPLIRSGRLDPAEIVSHRFPLAGARDAYELFAARRDGVLKVVLEP